MPRKLLTVDEVAETLRVSSRTVRTMIAEGTLPAFRLRPGRRSPLRVHDRDLRRVMRPQNTNDRAGTRSLGDQAVGVGRDVERTAPVR